MGSEHFGRPYWLGIHLISHMPCIDLHSHIIFKKACSATKGQVGTFPLCMIHHLGMQGHTHITLCNPYF